jgi:hypothetical protein
MIQVGRKAQIHGAKLEIKDGRRPQISSVGRKLLYEIHPRYVRFNKVKSWEMKQNTYSLYSKGRTDSSEFSRLTYSVITD